MSSYTYTDISIGFFGLAEKLFRAFSDKMTFKTLDVEKAPASQGFEPNSYDIVIASNVLHATPSLQKTLTNTRQLLKPGGYLLLLELTDPIHVLRSNTIFGVLPGWWLGVDDGRILAPTVTPAGWHSALRKAGFAGIDTITPEVNAVTWPASIIASQAVDERVQFLRRPLSSSLPSIYIESLVILGNGTLETARVAEELSEYLERFCGEVTILNSLPTEAEALTLNPMSTFINLVDVDSPIFKGITEEKMEGLKRMSDLAKHILWITQGALACQPYHMASIAFSRVLRAEAPHISLNNLDVTDLQRHDVSKVIAEHLLQLYALDEWESGGHQQLLWSKEPEAFLEGGKLKIPRLMSNVDQNARLNSARRVVTRQVPVGKVKVSISPPGANSPPSLVDLGPLTNQGSFVKVESSSLMALQVALDTFLFIAISKDDSGKDQTVLLSTSNTCETSPVATVTVSGNSKTAQSAEGLLVAVTSELLAETLVGPLSSGSHLLVYGSGKDRFLAAALSQRAACKAIRVTFAYDSDGVTDVQDVQDWLKLSARAPQHVIRKILHRAMPSHFLDLTTAFSPEHPSQLSLRITQALPGSKQIDPSTLFQRRSSLPLAYDREILISRLENAVTSVTAKSTAQEQFHDLVIRLDQINDPSTPYHATSAVHWPSNGLVKAEVRPLDVSGFFSKDKTYLLIGLSGKIGQSLCAWMVSNGAGCVCLTSRRPAIDGRWIDSFKGTGATVKVLPMDVTDKHSVESAVKTIRATCPPIAGVAHGAMVLHDSLFSRMSTDKMQEILGPKVDGANNLEDVFYEDKLDFFVMFSSVSSVLGNAGQSLYATGNGYLNGLARQRRKRGLAASTFDIGRVVGIGYVESAAQIVRDQLIGLGLLPISESDLRQAFAETIRAGFPDPKDKENLPEAVLTFGIRHFREDEDVKGPWFTNTLFSHCVIEKPRIESDSGDQIKKTTLPVGQQVSRATTKEQILDIILGKPSDYFVYTGFQCAVLMVRRLFLSEITSDITIS